MEELGQRSRDHKEEHSRDKANLCRATAGPRLGLRRDGGAGRQSQRRHHQQQVQGEKGRQRGEPGLAEQAGGDQGEAGVAGAGESLACHAEKLLPGELA
jgi:hypothetical protein